MRRDLGVLGHRRFRRLLFVISLSTFGDTALYLALGIWAKDLTGSNAAAGLVFLCLAIPVLFGPLAGHLTDRVCRRHLLIAVNAAAGVGVLALLFVRSEAQLWIIYAVAFGYGIVFALLRPAQAGLIKDLLPGAELGKANAALRTVGEMVRLFSPLFGAGVYAAAGGPLLAVLDAVTFAVAVIVLATLRIDESVSSERQLREPFRRAVLAGGRHILATPILMAMTAAVAASFAVIGVLDSVDFAVIDEGLHRPPSFFGVLMSIQALGGIAGGLAVATFMRRLGEPRTVATGLLLGAAGIALLALPGLPVVVAGFLLIGAGVPWFVVVYTTAWQRQTPPRLIGRVASAADLFMVGPQTLSIALGAILILHVDYRLLLVGCCLGLAGSGAVLLRFRKPDETAPTGSEPGDAPVERHVVGLPEAVPDPDPRIAGA